MRECSIGNGNGAREQVEVKGGERVFQGRDGDEAESHAGTDEGRRLACVVALDQAPRLHGQAVHVLNNAHHK